MFIFRKHRVRATDKKKTMNISEEDWLAMKTLSDKLKVPMVQVFHDAMTVYTGFVYGADDQEAKILEAEKNYMMQGWAKDLLTLKYYQKQFGEIELTDEIIHETVDAFRKKTT